MSRNCGPNACTSCVGPNGSACHGRTMAGVQELPAPPMKRGACAHGECATRHAALDRHGRRHLPDGIASATRRTSGDVQEAWSSVLESPMSQAAVHRPPARFDASVLPGAKPAPFPGFVEPSHPTLRDKAPSGGRWIQEIKFDGGPTTWTSQYRANASTRSLGELPVRHADSRCWHHQDRGRSAKPARPCSGCRLALATRTDSSASLVASVKIRSADERV